MEAAAAPIVLSEFCLMQTFSTASDSESDQAHKQKFFQQLEAQWHESHEGEQIDYALLNRLTSSSFDPESSSSPDKSPLQKGKHQGKLTYSKPFVQDCKSTEPPEIAIIG